jgi:hypothetical protein
MKNKIAVRMNMRKNNRNFWIIWFTVSAISFLLFFLGFKLVLASQISAWNITAYILVSLILGTVSSSLYLFNLRIPCFSLLAGLLVGFFEMYRVFFYDINGWGNLVGLMSLFTWSAIGLFGGAAGQFIWFVCHKIETHRKEQ